MQRFNPLKQQGFNAGINGRSKLTCPDYIRLNSKQHAKWVAGYVEGHAERVVKSSCAYITGYADGLADRPIVSPGIIYERGYCAGADIRSISLYGRDSEKFNGGELSTYIQQILRGLI